MKSTILSLLLFAALPRGCVFAQTVVGSARVACDGHESGRGASAPIVGAIINQTNTSITDLEVELSIITR